MRKYWTKYRPKTCWASSKSCISMYQITLQISNPFKLCDLYSHCIYQSGSTPCIQCSHSSTSPISQRLQSNSGFNFTASYNGVSRLPSRKSLIYLWSQWMLVIEEDFLVPFLNPCLKNQNHMIEAEQFCCLLRLNHDSII